MDVSHLIEKEVVVDKAEDKYFDFMEELRKHDIYGGVEYLGGIHADIHVSYFFLLFSDFEGERVHMRYGISDMFFENEKSFILKDIIYKFERAKEAKKAKRYKLPDELKNLIIRAILMDYDLNMDNVEKQRAINFIRDQGIE